MLGSIIHSVKIELYIQYLVYPNGSCCDTFLNSGSKYLGVAKNSDQIYFISAFFYMYCSYGNPPKNIKLALAIALVINLAYRSVGNRKSSRRFYINKAYGVQEMWGGWLSSMGQLLHVQKTD